MAMFVAKTVTFGYVTSPSIFCAISVKHAAKNSNRFALSNSKKRQ